jgi:purine-binding chemotaxis protein CheW
MTPTDMTQQSNAKRENEQDVSRLAGKYMTFKLSNEEYGLEILRVREIIGLMNITPVPKTDDFIRGIINLRGKVEPVVDLRMKFGMEKTEPTDQTVIIVVQYQHRDGEVSMGILVDEVLEVLNVTQESIEPPPNFGAGANNSGFILGIGKYGKRVIFLLDIGKILSSEETVLNRQASKVPLDPSADQQASMNEIQL